MQLFTPQEPPLPLQLSNWKGKFVARCRFLGSSAALTNKAQRGKKGGRRQAQKFWLLRLLFRRDFLSFRPLQFSLVFRQILLPSARSTLNPIVLSSERQVTCRMLNAECRMHFAAHVRKRWLLNSHVFIFYFWESRGRWRKWISIACVPKTTAEAIISVAGNPLTVAAIDFYRLRRR